MEDILVFLILLMYIGSAVYFCAITGKLFQVRKLKLPILFFISPSVAVVAALFSHNVQISFDTVLKTTIAGVAVETGIQLALELIFMGLYVRLVQAKNRSIAVFIYLCSAMLVPGVMVLYEAVQEKTGLIPVIAYIGLHIFFYKMIVIPLSELTKEKQVTDMKLFLVMPVLTYVFHTVMYIMFLFTLNMIDYSALDVSGIGDFLRSDPKGEKVIDLLHLWRDIIYTQTAAFVYPSIFTLLVLTIAVSIIVKNIRYMNESRKAHEEVKALNIEVMEALAHTIDAKDEYTRGHSVRVAKYSRMIAEKMKLSAEECENVYYMGLLHDIGKIGVPNEIINKPGALTDQEYGIVKGHPITGYDILSEIKTRPDLSTGARWHHEKVDGNGYPDHKRGEEIPLPARIIAVADSYDAMTSNRSYRNYLSQDVVKNEILGNIGTQFDEAAAKAMLQIMEEDVTYELHE